jgi:hypothetical protein
MSCFPLVRTSDDGGKQCRALRAPDSGTDHAHVLCPCVSAGSKRSRKVVRTPGKKKAGGGAASKKVDKAEVAAGPSSSGKAAQAAAKGKAKVAATRAGASKARAGAAKGKGSKSTGKGKPDSDADKEGMDGEEEQAEEEAGCSKKSTKGGPGGTLKERRWGARPSDICTFALAASRVPSRRGDKFLYAAACMQEWHATSTAVRRTRVMLVLELPSCPAPRRMAFKRWHFGWKGGDDTGGGWADQAEREAAEMIDAAEQDAASRRGLEQEQQSILHKVGGATQSLVTAAARWCMMVGINTTPSRVGGWGLRRAVTLGSSH